MQGGKFIFFDVVTNILYEGILTTKLSNVVGTAIVYEAGVMVNTGVVVTGTVTNGSKIQLTLAAKGNFKGGSIDAMYDSQYKRAADNARITTVGKSSWTELVKMKIVAMNMSFQVLADNQYIAVSNNSDASKRCKHQNAKVVLNSAVNVYELQEDIVVVAGGSTCDIAATGYKGFAAVVDGNNFSNNILWYAVTNGSFSVFAILTR